MSVTAGMSRTNEDTVQIGPRIDAALWERFKDFVQSKHGRTSGSTADEVEQALKQRMGEDPLQQVDDRLRRLESALDVDHPPTADSSSGERETVSKDPEQNSLSARTQNRVDDILGQLPGRFDEDQLDAAIQNAAGTSYKTIKRYKEILQRRQLAVACPWSDDADQTAYYQDKSMFAVAAVQNLTPQEVHTLEDKLAVQWGSDWFDRALPDDMSKPSITTPDRGSSDGSDGTGPGFQ